MIEYDISVCYGTIITDEERQKINNLFSDDYALDDFYDCYLRQINSWTGGDWFLGLYHSFEPPVIPVKTIHFDKAELEELEEIIQQYNIPNWTPQTYIIQFCY